MKILHIVPTYKPAYIYGGPIESVASLCESLQVIGSDVHVITTTANGEKELDVEIGKEIDVDNVFVIYFSRLTKGNTNISLSLWYYLYRHCRDYEIVHIHSWWNPLVVIASIICHYHNVRVIISPRGMLSHYIMTKTHKNLKKWIHILIGKWALKKATFHATSDAELIECHNLIPSWKGFQLPNIINLPDKCFTRTDNDIFTLIYLSRIHPKKGLEYLFEAISYLDEPIRLKIAGTGDESYIRKLQRDAVSLKIEHLIDWIGWKGKEEKFVELSTSDLFVLTSFNENFANVVIESLYVGTPVLISNTVGLANFVEEHNLGWVTELDAKAIALVIQTAKNDKLKRDLINRNGRAIIGETFSKKALAQKYTDNYINILNYY